MPDHIGKMSLAVPRFRDQPVHGPWRLPLHDPPVPSIQLLVVRLEVPHLGHGPSVSVIVVVVVVDHRLDLPFDTAWLPVVRVGGIVCFFEGFDVGFVASGLSVLMLSVVLRVGRVGFAVLVVFCSFLVFVGRVEDFHDVSQVLLFAFLAEARMVPGQPAPELHCQLDFSERLLAVFESGVVTACGGVFDILFAAFPDLYHDGLLLLIRNV